MYVSAICWLVWRPACCARSASLPATSWVQTGCRSCITAGNYSPKTGTVPGNNSHQSTIFSAMKRHCCCQHCFLGAGMTRQWEWSGAMLYKEDYKDKTTLTSLKFEDTSRETWRLSKLSCLLERVATRCFLRPCGCDGSKKIQILSFTSGLESWHLTEKHFSKWQPSTRTQQSPPPPPPPALAPLLSAEDIFFQCNTTNK